MCHTSLIAKGDKKIRFTRRQGRGDQIIRPLNAEEIRRIEKEIAGLKAKRLKEVGWAPTKQARRRKTEAKKIRVGERILRQQKLIH